MNKRPNPGNVPRPNPRRTKARMAGRGRTFKRKLRRLPKYTEAVKFLRTQPEMEMPVISYMPFGILNRLPIRTLKKLRAVSVNERMHFQRFELLRDVAHDTLRKQLDDYRRGKKIRWFKTTLDIMSTDATAERKAKMSRSELEEFVSRRLDDALQKIAKTKMENTEELVKILANEIREKQYIEEIAFNNYRIDRLKAEIGILENYKGNEDVGRNLDGARKQLELAIENRASAIRTLADVVKYKPT